MAKVKLNQKQIDALRKINNDIRVKVPNFEAINKLVDIAIKNNDATVVQKALKNMLDDEGSTPYKSELKEAINVIRKDKFSPKKIFFGFKKQTLENVVIKNAVSEVKPNVSVSPVLDDQSSVVSQPPVVQASLAPAKKSDEELKKEKEEKNIRILAAVLNEIRTSEEKYNAQLHKLFDFYAELKATPKLNQKNKELVSKIQNIEKIVKMSDELLNRLEVARRNLTDNPRKHAAEISKIFVEDSTRWVAGGYGDYIAEFQGINKLIEELKLAKDPLFIKIQKVLMAKSDGLDVASHVILPVQRLPRYVLLLKEVVKNHTSGLADDNFKYDVLTKVEAAAKAFNEKERVATIQEVLETLDKQLKAYVYNRTSILNGVRKVLGGVDRDLKVVQAKSAMTQIKVLMNLKGIPDKLDIQGAPQEMVLELLKKLLREDYATIKKSKFGGEQGEFSTYLLAAINKLDTDYSKSNDNPWNNIPVVETKDAKQKPADSMRPPVLEVRVPKVTNDTLKPLTNRKLRKERAKAGEFKVSGTNEKGEGVEWSPVIDSTENSPLPSTTLKSTKTEPEVQPKLSNTDIQRYNQVKKNMTDVLKRAIQQAIKAKVDENLINDWNKELVRILSIKDKEELKRQGFGLNDKIKVEIEKVRPFVGDKPAADNDLRKDLAQSQMATKLRGVSEELGKSGEQQLSRYALKNPKKGVEDLNKRLSNDGVKDPKLKDHLMTGLSKKEDIQVESKDENHENLPVTPMLNNLNHKRPLPPPPKGAPLRPMNNKGGAHRP